MESQRIDLHTHTFFSDGDLAPAELVRRAQVKEYAALAIADHGDASNLEELFARLYKFLAARPDNTAPFVIPAVELTHLAPAQIAPLARRAKELGAGLVVVHGETVVEPVAAGTNRAAVECPDVDILAHPGLVTVEEARTAAQNGVYLEISARKGHSLTNGLVAQRAREAGARLVVNTDGHSPADLIDQAMACIVARGAGMGEAQVEAATIWNPRQLVERAQGRMRSFMNRTR